MQTQTIVIEGLALGCLLFIAAIVWLMRHLNK